MAGGTPLFSVKFSVLLGIFLCVPYAFKSLTRVEPFPALIFPEGAGKIRVAAGTAEFNHLAVWGYDANGQLQPLNPVRFLDPIPVQYLRALAGRDFGLAAPKPARKGVLGALTAPRLTTDPAEREEISAWLRARLRAAGLDTRKLIVRSDTIRVEMASGRELSRSTQEQRVVPLD